MNDGQFSHMAERKIRRQHRDDIAAQDDSLSDVTADPECGCPTMTVWYREYPGAQLWPDTTTEHRDGCSDDPNKL